MNTVVIHVRDAGQHADAIYIGREFGGRGRGRSFKRSRFANPWSTRVVGRDRAIALFARWITGDPDAAAALPPGNWSRPTIDEIRSLRGRVLACWCEPLACHGHALAAMADESNVAGALPAAGLVEDERPRHAAPMEGQWKPV